MRNVLGMVLAVVLVGLVFTADDDRGLSPVRTLVMGAIGVVLFWVVLPGIQSWFIGRRSTSE